MADLSPLFNPGSIAVVGANADEEKLGGRLLFCLRARGFPGAIYPVNPRQSEIQGLKAYPSLEALPETVDLVLVIVRSELVLEILEQCAAHGARGAVVFSSGFAEAGGAHADLQAEITAFSRRTGLPVSGPNGEGFWARSARCAATFSPTVLFEDGADDAVRHEIAVVAQSGGVGFALFNRGMSRRLGFTYVTATGNEADIGAVDVIDFYLDDPETRIMLAFIESIRDGRRFREVAARAAALGKPLIITKVGRSAAGQRAAASHTAALAGSAAVFDAVAARHGVIVTHDPEEMLDIAAAFAAQPLPAGRRVGVVTSSGGSGVWLADGLAAEGLELPELSPGLQQRINDFIPYYGAAGNPVDVTAQTTRSGGLFKAANLLMESGEVDMVVMAGPLASAGFIERSMDAMREAAGRPVPLLYFAYSLPSAETRRVLGDAGIHPFTTVTGVARAARALAEAAETGTRPVPAAPASVSLPAWPSGFDAPGALSEARSLDLLEHFGLPVPPRVLASSAAEAEAAARDFSTAVAMKIQSPGIPHKTDIGGVALNVTADAVAANFARLIAAAGTAAPGAALEGVLVTPMAPAGHEIIAGAQIDGEFGPVVLVGAGGIHVEILRDSAVLPAPCGPADARGLIDALKIRPLLAGARGQAGGDVDALAALLARLSHLIALPGSPIAEIDLNPVLLHADGLTLADALVVLRADSP